MHMRQIQIQIDNGKIQIQKQIQIENGKTTWKTSEEAQSMSLCAGSSCFPTTRIKSDISLSAYKLAIFVTTWKKIDMHSNCPSLLLKNTIFRVCSGHLTGVVHVDNGGGHWVWSLRRALNSFHTIWYPKHHRQCNTTSICQPKYSLPRHHIHLPYPPHPKHQSTSNLATKAHTCHSRHSLFRRLPLSPSSPSSSCMYHVMAYFLLKMV